MDCIHDLGGKEGYGPIPIEDGDKDFDFDWERRMWGMARSGIAHDITIDWFRHTLERMVPGDYLTYRYFQKWCTTYFALMIDNGQFTLEEVLSGKVKDPDQPAAPKTVQDVLELNRSAAVSFETEPPAPPRYQVGDTIRTKRRITNAPHTRLPAYARDCEGQIVTHHGAHLLADEGAKGIHVGEHLYTVAFNARELWGNEANPRDSVTLELWESYFV